MNATEAKLHPVKGRGEPISQQTLDFEGLMIEIMLNQSDFPPGLKGSDRHFITRLFVSR